MMGLKSINKDDEFIIETIAYFSYMEQCLDNKIIKKELFDQMYNGLSKTQKEIVSLYMSKRAEFSVDLVDRFQSRR